MRRVACILVIGGLIWGCARGYEGANREIVAALPRLENVQLLDEDYYGFCSDDSCPLGNDRSGARLVYAVDKDAYTQASLIDTYRAALADWTATVEDACADRDPSACDETIQTSFTRGDARIDLNLDNWSAGEFELHVDAEGAG